MGNSNRFKTMILQAGLISAIFLGASSFSTYTSNKEKNTQFLIKAAEINLEEIDLGKLAQQKSTMTDVKELGKMMETDHHQSMNELIALADKKTIILPTSPTREAQEAYTKLAHKSEATFDRSYCDRMVNGHKEAIALFEKESKESNDADIRKWATETLPHLHIHLEHALACQSKCEKM